MVRAESKKHNQYGMLAVIAALLTGSACAAGAAAPPEPAPASPGSGPSENALRVVAATVSETTMPIVATFSGSLVADRESVVAAGATGKVEATHVERGDYVAQGALLATLDRRQTSATLAEAEAQLATAKEQASLAKLDCDRNEQLHTRGALSDAEYDRAKSSCATTAYSLAGIQARRDNAAAALRDTEIRAPFAGFVSERWVTVGEYVTPAAKVATLVAIDPIRAQLTIPEAFAATVTKGQTVQLELSGPKGPVSATGVIRYVSPTIRASSRDLVVEAVVKNTDHSLRPGTFVVARVDLGEQRIPSVPRSAIVSDGGTKHLFAIVDGTLQQRVVQTGATQGELVAVTRGVSLGETVAAVASPQLRDGGRVQ